MNATAAHDVVFSAVRAAWARREAMSVSEWAGRHRMIVAQEAAEPGRWRNERTPYLRGIMDAFNDPGVNRISVMKAERVGGSEAVLNILGYIIDQAPGPVLWMYPTEDMAFEVNRKRLMPTIKRTPALAAHMTGRAWDARLLDIQLDRMSIACRGSNSESKVEALGFKYLIKDELDRMAPNISDVVRGRGAANPGAKDIELGTPELEWSGDASDRTQGIDRSYKQGDRRRLMVPCPHCGEYHQRTFKRVKWIGDLDADPDFVERSAYFICPCVRGDGSVCDGIIHGHHNPQQLAECVWCPEGWAVLRGGVLVAPDGERFQAAGGVYVPTRTSHASFAIHGLYTPFKANPYGYLAREFVANKGQTTREWLNRRMGEPWSLKGQVVEASRMQVLCGWEGAGVGSEGPAGDRRATPGTHDGPAGDRRATPGTHDGPAGDRRATRAPQWMIGTVPSEVAVLTGFCDVQADRMYLEVVGWDAACERRWLVDRVAIGRVVGDGLEALNDYASIAEWPVVEMATGKRLGARPISVLGVDSGFFTDEVYDFCRPRQGGYWRARPDGKGGKCGAEVIATKGEYFPGAGAAGAAPWRFSWPEDKEPHLGSANPGRNRGVMLLLINTGFFKRVVRDAIRANLAMVEQEDGGKDPAGDRGATREDPAGDRGATRNDPAGDRRATRNLFFPEDTGRGYFDQLTSEQERAVLVRGRYVTQWSRLPGQRDNHFLDCRVGNECLVRAVNVAKRLARAGGGT